MRSSALLLWPLLVLGCADFARGPAFDAGPSPIDDLLDGGPALRFAADVHAPLLADCRFCHEAGGPAGSSGWVLNGDVDDDYAASLLFVDERDPPSSRLLTKAEGRAHGGGAIYLPGSAAHDLVLRWMSQGALP